jgi:hypothetical protein
MQGVTFFYSANYYALTIQIDPGAIRAVGGPVFPRLLFPCHFESVPQKGLREGRFTAFQAELSLPSLGKIADANPILFPVSVKSDQPFCWNWDIEVPLDLYRAEKMEALRKTDVDLQLLVRVTYSAYWESSHPVVSLGNVDLGASAMSVHLKIDQSRWIQNILPGLGLDTVKLIEIPLGKIADSPEMQRSIRALDNARDRLKRGVFDDAAMHCRIALEPFFEQVDKPDGGGKMPQLKKSWETRLGLAAYKWLAESLNAIKLATNPSHHSTTPHFDKFEAEMLVTITSTLVAYAARFDS